MASQESLKESAWARLEELRPSLEEHAQGHLLQFAAELGEAERGALADELASLDVGKIVKVFKASMAGGAGESKKDDRLEPLEPSICGSTLRDESRVAGWEEAGLEEIGRGKVGGAGAVQQGRGVHTAAHWVVRCGVVGAHGEEAHALRCAAPPPGGSTAAGRRPRHASGCVVPQGHVRRGSPFGEVPLPAAGRADPQAAAASTREERGGLHHTLVRKGSGWGSRECVCVCWVGVHT